MDNCALLIVEACLLNNLTELFEPEQSWSMDATRLAEIAAEPEEARTERTQAQAQHVALESVISTCRRYERPLEGESTLSRHKVLRSRLRYVYSSR